MHKGDKMLCAMLVDGQPTGETSAVTICEVRRDAGSAVGARDDGQEQAGAVGAAAVSDAC